MDMNRRTFMKQSCVGAAGLALSGYASAFGSTGQNPPNMIFVIADQLGTNHCGYADYWNGHYAGAQHASTPNLDQFAAEGINLKIVSRICPSARPSGRR